MDKSQIKNTTITFVIVVCVVGLIAGGWFYFSTVGPDQDTSNSNIPIGKNEIVLQNENGSFAEGNKLPDDLDLLPILPDMPVSSELVAVSDNHQSKIRIVRIEFIVPTNRANTEKHILDSLNTKNWDQIVQLDTGVTKARLGEYHISIVTNEIDTLKTSVNIAVTIYTE